jgi:hypothetical protein
MQATPQDESVFLLTDKSSRIVATLTLSGAQGCAVEPAMYHPNFGVSLSCQKIVGRYQGKIPVELGARISWPDRMTHSPRARSNH